MNITPHQSIIPFEILTTDCAWNTYIRDILSMTTLSLRFQALNSANFSRIAKRLAVTVFLSNNIFVKGGKMTIKKFILTATVTASLFALTVPASFATCNTCPKAVEPRCETGYGCPIEKESTCHKCKKEKPKCKCKKEKTKCKKECKEPCNPCPSLDSGAATGGAASMKGVPKYGRQIYSYPNAVYTNANASVVGEPMDNAEFTDKPMKKATGVLIEDLNCMTGAAMPIIDETCGFAAPLPCDCTVNIQSPTSMQIGRKFYEPHTFEHTGPTGAAAGMNGDYYPDVPDRYWASPEINRLTCQDVVVGYPDGLFRPNRDISRAEMSTMAVKGYNKTNVALSSEGDFSDVPKCHWAYENINRGATTDLLEGKTDCMFDPSGKMTRLEALNVIGKGMTCPMTCENAEAILSKYSDGNKVPQQYRENVAKALEGGALKHQNQKTISLHREATRAEVSTMLQNMRLALGLDNMAIACEPCKTQGFIEKETMMTVPTLELKMKDIISAKDANVGDQFAATTINDITIAGVTYPAGSRVNGKVMEVIRPSKCEEGAIRLSFTQIVGCDGCKADLPKQILTARVEDAKDVNAFTRIVKLPFTWAGSLLGTVGRTAGGIVVGAANAVEDVFDNFGNGTGELLTGNFRASGRSYQDSLKSTVMLPIDAVRTTVSGGAGLLETTGDEFTYLVNPSGYRMSQVNPKQKITVAFGQ